MEANNIMLIVYSSCASISIVYLFPSVNNMMTKGAFSAFISLPQPDSQRNFLTEHYTVPLTICLLQESVLSIL